MGVLEYIGAWAIHRIPLISLEMGVFALLITVLLRLRVLRPARIQKWFWLLVLAKPLVMLVVISPLALNVSVFQNVNSLPQAAQDPAFSQTSVDVSGKFPPPDRRVSTSATGVVSQHPSFWSLIRGSFSWPHGLAVLWICGTVFLCGRALMGLRRLGKLRQQAVPLDCLHDILASLGSSLGIRRLPEVKVSSEISSPLLFGLLHPVILLPSGLYERLAPGALRLTLLHELFHWRHRDTWILLLGRLVEAFFFFHPAVWYAGRMAVRASEEACDDAVVSFTGNSAGYASCLLSISQGAGIQRRYALAGLAVKDSAVGKRIRRILRESVPVISRKAVILSVSLLAMVSVLGLPALLASKSGIEASRLVSDEGRIAFSRSGLSIRVMDPDGKNEKQLTTYGIQPAFSPNGKQIAFVSTIKDGIYIMNADGSNVRQLTNDVWDGSPAWSPDGKQIAFHRNAWEQVDGNWKTKSASVCVIDSDGANLKKLIDMPGSAATYNVDWSHDGSRIAFDLAGGIIEQIWIMDADGGNAKMIHNQGWKPAWSPDGSRIVFASVRDSMNAFRQAWRDIYVMNSDGSNVIRISDLNHPETVHDEHPDWSPDGTKIVFCSTRDNPMSQAHNIYVMDADGSDVQRLTSTPGSEGSDGSPDWTAFSYAVKPAGKLRKAWGWIKAR